MRFPRSLSIRTSFSTQLAADLVVDVSVGSSPDCQSEAALGSSDDASGHHAIGGRQPRQVTVADTVATHRGHPSRQPALHQRAGVGFFDPAAGVNTAQFPRTHVGRVGVMSWKSCGSLATGVVVFAHVPSSGCVCSLAAVPNNFPDSILDDEYVARVRRHAPSSLIPLLAAAAAKYSAPGSWHRSPWLKFTPWALADIARVSLVSGNEHRAPATLDDLLRCCAAYVAVRDPELSADDPESLTGFMLRITSEQLSYEQSPFHLAGRTAALFQDTQPTKSLQVVRPGWDAELLGCTLSQYVGTGVFIHAAATKNEGRFSAEWFNQPDLTAITAVLPHDLLARITDGNFVASTQWFRSRREQASSGAYRRFNFNPLLDKPVVAGIGTELLIPVPAQLFRKISPLGLYYSGVKKWENRFSEDVGDLFEQYVGRQLRLVPNSEVHPEIVYDKDNKRSVDWIVVCEDTVILVEVKSIRPTKDIRLGNPNAVNEFKRMLGRAFKQLNTTDELIARKHPRFAHIPSNLPRVALIVTMEPFEVANAKPILDFQEVAPNIPTNVCASSDLELLVTLQDQDVGQFLMGLLTDESRPGYQISTGLTDHALGRNAVLDEAWASYEWGPQQTGWSPPELGNETAET